MTLIELVNSELDKLDDAFDEFDRLKRDLNLERNPLPKSLSYNKIYRLTRPISAKTYIIYPPIMLELQTPCVITSRLTRDMIRVYFYQDDQELYVSLKEFIDNTIEVDNGHIA